MEMKPNDYKGNCTKQGYSIKRLPLIVNGKDIGEKVMYIGDISPNELQIATDKTYYYTANLDEEYVVVYNDKVVWNTATDWRYFTGDNWVLGKRG